MKDPVAMSDEWIQDDVAQISRNRFDHRRAGPRPYSFSTCARESTMTEGPFHADPQEENKHSYAIQRLAREEGLAEREIRRIYENALNDFSRQAKVRLFLPILVSRKVRAVLHSEANA